MTAPTGSPLTSRVLTGVFLAAVAVNLALVTLNLRSGFLVGHEFRQTQTAINAYYIDRQDNFSLLYETPLVGKPWVSILMEVPIYEWSVVGLSRATGWAHPVCARLISIASFYLLLPALYLLLRRFGQSRPRSLFVLALVLTCPVYIFYSRAFLMDAMELMCCGWFLYAYLRMMDERRWTWFLFASVAGTGASLIKSATLAIWLGPAAAYVAWQLWREWRQRAGFGALAQTVFWGLAGVAIPLGTLRAWIALTDPLKAAHPSAWIFTSENLAMGNWGFRDLTARFSPSLWGTLADRWNEAIMPPWLLLVLLVAGFVGVRAMRRPALILAGVFFLSQLLFPFAYAYQDYYFYSCAVFVVAALGYFGLGLLDSRAPRWLCVGLLAVPFAAQLLTYHGYYFLQHRARSDGGFSYTMALRDLLPRDSVLVVVGADWSGIIPYYSQHKALMVRNGLENQPEYLQRAFGDLADEEVSALVMADPLRNHRGVIERAVAQFDLDPSPTVRADLVDIYVSRRFRDEFKRQVATNFGDLKVDTSALPPAGPAKPYRISPAHARDSLPNFSPAPLRAYFQMGLGYIWVDHTKVVFAHPNSDVWIRAPGNATQITWEFGMVAEAYERAGARTDGVELFITGQSADGERTIYQRRLDPANEPTDRGPLKVSFPYEPRPGEILRFSDRPGAGAAFDWVYWSKIEVK